MTQHKYTLPRQRSLKRKLLIDALFKEGHSVVVYPLRLVYLQVDYPEDVPYMVGFSVPKKKIRKAVQRNRIKRLMRESFRLQQHQLNLPDKTIMMWIYLDKKLPDYETIYNKMTLIINELSKPARFSKPSRFDN